MKCLYCILLFLTTLTHLPASFADSTFNKEIEIVREAYLTATDGTERDIRKASQKIRKLENKYPSHPLVLAYKGGALSLRGKDIGKRPLDRMRETEEGLNIIDRALRKLSQHDGDYLEIIETQLVATYVFINLPDSIFHRLREGDHLVKQLLVHPQFSEMPQGLQAAIYFAAAIAADKRNDQTQFQDYLELTLKTDPNGKNGQQAQALLQQLTD